MRVKRKEKTKEEDNKQQESAEKEMNGRNEGRGATGRTEKQDECLVEQLVQRRTWVISPSAYTASFKPP